VRSASGELVEAQHKFVVVRIREELNIEFLNAIKYKASLTAFEQHGLWDFPVLRDRDFLQVEPPHEHALLQNYNLLLKADHELTILPRGAEQADVTLHLEALQDEIRGYPHVLELKGGHVALEERAAHGRDTQMELDLLQVLLLQERRYAELRAEVKHGDRGQQLALRYLLAVNVALPLDIDLHDSRDCLEQVQGQQHEVVLVLSDQVADRPLLRDQLQRLASQHYFKGADVFALRNIVLGELLVLLVLLEELLQGEKFLGVADGQLLDVFLVRLSRRFNLLHRGADLADHLDIHEFDCLARLLLLNPADLEARLDPFGELQKDARALLLVYRLQLLQALLHVALVTLGLLPVVVPLALEIA